MKRLRIARVAGVCGVLGLAFGFDLGLAAPAMARDYVLNKGHTEIRFSWNHAGVSEQSGEFTAFEGTLSLDEADVTKSVLDVTIQTASMATGFKPLDDDLTSKNFFEVAKYPTIHFKSTAIRKTGTATAAVTGDLTIHGVTRPVTLDVKLVFRGKHPVGQFIDYYKGDWLGFSASGTLLRSDFGVGRYAPLVSDTIHLAISTELKAK